MQFWRVYDKKNRTYVEPCFYSDTAAKAFADGYNKAYSYFYEVEGPCWLRDDQWVKDNLAANGVLQ